MKTNLILFSLLAVPACAFAADAAPAPSTQATSDKPEGMLGVDTVSVFSNYYRDDAHFYHEGTFEEMGYGVGLNYNALNYGNFGVDVLAKYYYVTPTSPSYDYDEQRTFVGGTTLFYKLDNIVPFYTAQVYHHTVDYQSTTEANRFGVEIRLPDGFSITPSMMYTVDLDDGSPKTTVQWGLGANYWINDRFNVGVSMSYLNYCHVDECTYGLSFGYKVF